MESKLTKLLAPLERDEQSLMKLDAIFAVRILSHVQNTEIPRDSTALAQVIARFALNAAKSTFRFKLCFSSLKTDCLGSNVVGYRSFRGHD